MKIDFADLKKVVDQLEKDHCVIVSIITDRLNGIDRLIVTYTDVQGTDIKMTISESGDEGFNTITRTERF